MNTATQLSLAFGLERRRRTAWEKAAMFGTVYGMGGQKGKNWGKSIFADVLGDIQKIKKMEDMEFMKRVRESAKHMRSKREEKVDELMDSGRFGNRDAAEMWVRNYTTLGR